MKVINSFILFFLISCTTEHRDSRKILNESLRQCYVESDSYTGKDGQVQGSMNVKLSVTPDQRVKDCKIMRTDFKDPNLNACVCGFLRLSQVPNSSGKIIEVNRPINFFPVDQ